MIYIITLDNKDIAKLHTNLFKMIYALFDGKWLNDVAADEQQISDKNKLDNSFKFTLEHFGFFFLNLMHSKIQIKAILLTFDPKIFSSHHHEKLLNINNYIHKLS